MPLLCAVYTCVLVLTILLYGDEEAQTSPYASVTSLLEETRENCGSWDDEGFPIAWYSPSKAAGVS
jgi:hypothetical protein